MSKLKLKANQIASIRHNAGILRSFPTFSMALSDKLNALVIAVTPAQKWMDEQAELFSEKTKSINLMVDGEEKIKAIEQIEKDVKKVNDKVHEVEFEPIKKSEFDGKDIGGEKHVEKSNGHVSKFNYRDAYYELINEGAIA